MRGEQLSYDVIISTPNQRKVITMLRAVGCVTSSVMFECDKVKMYVIQWKKL